MKLSKLLKNRTKLCDLLIFYFFTQELSLFEALQFPFSINLLSCAINHAFPEICKLVIL